MINDAIATVIPNPQKPPFMTPNPEEIQGINNLTIQAEDLKTIQNIEGPGDLADTQRPIQLNKLLQEYKAIDGEAAKIQLNILVPINWIKMLKTF
ncbi:hypothetical protein TRFO_06524 [Tritrichomonas foetus]|uniref:Uncharacterized protein n=1 Tax=Tritrichomonas foetus TaxID=1144522 RepID=A0A1J4JYZ9_9EUKA|nr:hypothetical protein TRFO_06524 [Tritrichomonas foetus]|eukprot:OHT03712.1 hypothetical protein TRFO_06524 [Tritrichomonas foetus]